MPVERNGPYDQTPPVPRQEDRELEILLDIPDAEMGNTAFRDVEASEAEPEILPLDFTGNLAELIDDEELDRIGTEILGSVEADKQTMTDWEQIYVDGMKLLGFNIKNTEDELFPDSCTVTHPILAESIVKYQAKARSQILRADAIARAKILGYHTPEKKLKAERQAAFLNYQVQEQMPEYGPEHDRMLFHQAFGGSAFTKMYYDATLKRPVSKFIKPTDFIIDYNATDLESAYRYTEVITINVNDLRRAQLDGLYRQFDDDEKPATGKPTGMGSEVRDQQDKLAGRSDPTGDEVSTLYEVHTYYAFEGDADDRTDEERDIGLEFPYIITIDAKSGKVYSIRRNWKEGDLRNKKRVWYTHWVFIPGFGFHGFGYIHLIGGLARSATSSLRQLIDSGSFANLQGGFKVHGLRVLGNNEPISPGEWRDVQAPGMDIQKALLPLPYKEPSQTLMALLQFVVTAAQKFADSTEQVVAESTNYGPVGTTLALLEASGRLFTGIHERLFAAQKRELDILMAINAETLGDSYPFEMAGGKTVIAASDFEDFNDVVPVTDPREPTAAHRAARANATLAVAGQFPQEHNMPEVLLDLHTALGAEDPARYLKRNKPPVSTDPVTENQLLLVGAPVASKPEQDHMAHVKVHLAIVENDLYAANEGVVAAVMAHVQAHLADHFRVQMMQLGVQMPAQGQQTPPEMEKQIAMQAANAVDKIKATYEKPKTPEQEIEAAKIEIEASKLRLQAIELKKQEQLKREEMKLRDRQFKEKLKEEKRRNSMEAAIHMVDVKENAKRAQQQKGVIGERAGPS